MGNGCVLALNNLLKSRILSRTSKIKLYKTLILPVVTYGSDTWTIMHADKEKFLIFKSVLCKSFGQ